VGDCSEGKSWFILAKMGVINWNSENKVFRSGFGGYRFVLFSLGRENRRDG
jgi:hypothetical protein